jgi:hypothetical protein
VSHQCTRESWALHSDYYSTTKKTASRLTKRVRERSERSAASFAGATLRARSERACDFTSALTRDSDESQKYLRIGHFLHV